MSPATPPIWLAAAGGEGKQERTGDTPDPGRGISPCTPPAYPPDSVSLDDNRGLHERVNLAMIGEGASFGEGEAERPTIGRDGCVEARVEGSAIVAGDGMGRARGIRPGDGRAYLDGDGGRAEGEGAAAGNRHGHSGT